MEISEIKSMIDKTMVELDFDTENMIKNSASFLRKQEDIVNEISKHGVSKRKALSIANSLVKYTIQSGIKAVYKGNLFNKIVSAAIKRTVQRYSHIEFKSEYCHTQFQERLDWYLINKRTRYVIAGFNQIDLWSGGAQYNRGSKYILDETLHRALSKKRIKLVCVVYNVPPSIRKGTKLYNILSRGLERNRLVYIKGLKKMIREFVQKR